LLLLLDAEIDLNATVAEKESQRPESNMYTNAKELGEPRTLIRVENKERAAGREKFVGVYTISMLTPFVAAVLEMCCALVRAP